MTEATTYPDVLGFIAQNPGLVVGPVEVALALRPRIIRAGRSFEAILMIQNTMDVPVEVKARLSFPDKDAGGQKDRFRHSGELFAVEVPAAETGYILIPMATESDMIPADNYPIGVAVNAKPLGKGNRIRKPGEEPRFDSRTLAEEKRRTAKELFNLKFSTENRGGLMRGNLLEAELSVLQGRGESQPIETNPDWHSLWSLHDQDDMDLLLSKYRELLRFRFIPKLTRKTFFQPIYKQVETLFSDSQYTLRETEISCITKLLVLILEYASASSNAQAMVEAGKYNIEPYLNNTAYTSSNETGVPYWFRKILKMTAQDERVASAPLKAIMSFAFYDLLMDAMMCGFDVIERYAGEDLGTPEEMNRYAKNLIGKLKNSQAIGFREAYVPLVLGGILVFDRVMMPSERLVDGMEEIKYLLDDRSGERNESNDPVFIISQRIINQSLKKYGLLDNRL